MVRKTFLFRIELGVVRIRKSSRPVRMVFVRMVQSNNVNGSRKFRFVFLVKIFE